MRIYLALAIHEELSKVPLDVVTHGGGDTCNINLGFRVQGLGFRVQGSGLRVQGLGFRVQGSGLRNLSLGFRVQGSGFRV